jgi:hypothetical protein
MIASTSHDGGQHFLRRATHFARREIAARRGAVPVSVRMLSYFLLYLGGVSAAEIAVWEEERREALLPRLIEHKDVTPQDAADWASVSRRDIAKHLLACMAILGDGEDRARITALAEEMGRVNYEPRAGEKLGFPRSRRRYRQPTEAAS